jgi:hypothetical protein
MNTTNKQINKYYQSKKKYRIHKSILFHSVVIGLLGYWVIGLFPPTAGAAVSSDGNYSIEFEDIGNELPTPTAKPRVIPFPLPTTPNNPTSNQPTPYTITATNDAFSFSISQTIIDFGALTATNPVIRTSDISFSTPFYGAQVIGYENHPLINTEKNTIPDTTCDTGTCSQTIPSNWENDLTYGFGFHCESDSEEVCGRGFSDQYSFKQFADNSAKESPVSILLNQQSKHATPARITYKVNISGTQPVGGYSNTVTYIAIPNF